MRASRLVQLLLLLQTQGKMTAGRLATELEVSVRTIYRDVEALSGAGVPIYAEAGPGGGVRLVDGYRTRLTGLTADEAEALALSGLPGAASELGLGTVLAAAQLKVDAALPPELRSRAVRMRERFHLDAPGWFAREEAVPHLAVLSRAVWEEQRVEIRYRKSEGEVTRLLDPLGLVLKAGVWYLVALSGRSRSLRTFRVSRVLAVRDLAEECQRPADFDLASHWSQASEDFLDSWQGVPVVVRLRGDLLWLIRYVQGPKRAQPAIESASEPDAEGWVTVTLHFENHDMAGYELMRFGGDLEVLEPIEVRERVAERAASMVARYASVPA
ncbi:MAG: YafY family protein [Acidimicrobiales bacterium]